MTDPVVRARIALALPRRDYRFWAALAAAALLFSQAIAFTQILSDRNHWRNRFDDQRTEQLCRSVAGAGVSAAQAHLLGEMAANQTTIDNGLAAVALGDRDGLANIVDELLERARSVGQATAALDEAIDAQQEALRTCQPELPPDTTSTTTGG